MARETSAQKAARSNVTKVVGPGEASSKRRSRQAKADVEANAAKVHDINERNAVVSDFTTATPGRKVDRAWFAKLTAEAKAVVRKRVADLYDPIAGTHTVAACWQLAIGEAKKANTTDARKAGIEARAAARRSSFEDTGTTSIEEARKAIEADADEHGERPSEKVMRELAERAAARKAGRGNLTEPPSPPPSTPEPARGKTPPPAPAPKGGQSSGPSTRSKRGPRGIEAIAERDRLHDKRGAGRKVSDEELLAYVVKARKAHPDSPSGDERQFAYWIEKLVVPQSRWDAAWKAATAQLKKAS